MGRSATERKAQAAWAKIEALGGHGVWDGGLMVVSLADTAVTDADLELFRDFPDVQILTLSRTAVTDAGLAHLAGLRSLEELILVGTRVSERAIRAFRRAHPGVRVTTKPPPTPPVNPFTAEPR